MNDATLGAAGTAVPMQPPARPRRARASSA